MKTPGRLEIVEATFAAVLMCCLVSCTGKGDPQKAFELAQSAFQHGDVPTASRLAQKAFRDFHDVSPDWHWKILLFQARLLRWQGLNDEALKLLGTQNIPLPPGELQVVKLRQEAGSYTALHKFHEAEQSLQQAEQLCASLTTYACTDVLTARGKILMEHGEYSTAHGVFERVLALARAQKDYFSEANALLDLTWSANEQAHFDEALDSAGAAREIAIRLGFDDIAITSMGNVGWAYYRLGEPDQADTFLAEATQRAKQLRDTIDQLRWTSAHGYVDLDRGQFSIAEKGFEETLELARGLNSREDVINALIALAFVSEQTGKFDKASEYADEALKMARADANKRDQVYPRLVQGRVAAQHHDLATAEAAFREVAQAPDSPIFLKWQAQHSLARMYENENQPAAATEAYTAALSTFEGARKDLQQMSSRLPFLTNAESIYDDYIHFLIAQGKNDQALQVADFNRARTLTERLGILPEGSSFQPFALNAPQLARRIGGAILFYSLGQKQSYLWAINSRQSALIPLPPQAEIEAAIKRYHDTLTGAHDSPEASEADGRALYQMLVTPANDVLGKAGDKDGAHVFIIPDGSLNSLNFETLLVPDQKPRYWIEDVTISNAASLRMLSASRNGSSPRGDTLFLLGDAISPNNDYPPLRNAAAELATVSKHFPSARQQVLAGQQATPPAYLSNKPEEFSYIHFVAHGTDSRLSPLESAIVLTKATSADDSFKLYARDIIHHKVRADLVTISACYGAGERAYSGEGLVGLSWAFLGAGAHNVIGALWDVSDASTPQLMDQLYDGLKKGKAPSVALRAAKLSLLRSDSAFRKPYYWAPFQLYTGS